MLTNLDNSGQSNFILNRKREKKKAQHNTHSEQKEMDYGINLPNSDKPYFNFLPK